MRRRLLFFVLAVTWLALSLGLEKLTYEAAPWFDNRIPERWVELYLDWYGATDAETVADAEFAAMFAICALVTGLALAVPFVVARLTLPSRAERPRFPKAP